MAKAEGAQSWVAPLGAACLAVAHAWMAVGAGANQWGYSFGTGAVGAVVAAAGLVRPRETWGTRTAAAGFVLAALASANIVRLALFYPTLVDVAALALVFVGFLAGALAFLRRPLPNPDGMQFFLAGAAGGLVYLVHDVVRGVAGQLVPDVLLLAGFALAWFGLRGRAA
jgi:hypothetical protein